MPTTSPDPLWWVYWFVTAASRRLKAVDPVQNTLDLLSGNPGSEARCSLLSFRQGYASSPYSLSLSSLSLCRERERYAFTTDSPWTSCPGHLRCVPFQLPNSMAANLTALVPPATCPPILCATCTSSLGCLLTSLLGHLF